MAKRLYRSRSDRKIAGVCGGIAEHFDIDPVLVRVLAVILLLCGSAGLLAYIILWILVPEEGSV
jgi:phage shock protein C